MHKGTGIKDNVDLDLSVFIEKTEQISTPDLFLAKRAEIVKDVADKFARRFRWRKDRNRSRKKGNPRSHSFHQSLYHLCILFLCIVLKCKIFLLITNRTL